MYATIRSAHAALAHSALATPASHAPEPPAHMCSNTLHACGASANSPSFTSASSKVFHAASKSSL